MIDTEYIGKNEKIKGLIIAYLKNKDCYIEEHQIRFGFIGKKSKAHETANHAFKGEIKRSYINKKDITLLLSKKRDRVT